MGSSSKRKLVAYIRGGLGDIWIAISAIKPIIDKYQISKFDVTIISDSVYYFRDYPKGLERFSLDALHKISSNVIMVPPWINNNFRLDIDDVGEELSQENANKQKDTFMFWRPNSLKEFVKNILFNTEGKTIFIDALFAECIMRWDFQKQTYERVGKERAVFRFNPSTIEFNWIMNFLSDSISLLGDNPKYIVLHTRTKHEGTSHIEDDVFYNSIIEYCNLNEIIPIVIGVDSLDLKGRFVDCRGDNILSFEGMGFLIDKCRILIGNDSGISHMKLYQQQKHKLLIMNHARFERSNWCKDMFPKSNCLLLDAKENNIDKITKAIGEYYEDK